MKTTLLPWLMVGLVPQVAFGANHVDVCKLLAQKKPARNVTTTVAVIGAAPHGYVASSVACPKLSSTVQFALGDGRRARAFRRWAFGSPLLKSGVRTVQVTADYVSDNLTVRRVHAYRELSRSEASVFWPKRSASEQAAIHRAVTEAAESAQAAARR